MYSQNLIERRKTISNSILSSKKTLLLLGLTLTLAIAGAFAFFTDKVTTKATLTTSEKSVDITTNPTDPSDPDYDPDWENNLSAKWEDVNATALANYNPGDKVDLSFALKNTGSQAVDIRETFVITSSKALTEASPEFRLFQEAIQDAAGAWDGQEVVSAELINGNQIKYSIAPYVISSEIEAIDNNPIEVEKDYNLVFNKAASNAFQAATCKVEYLVEAKQHSADGPAGGWTEVETATIQFGGQSINAVPEKQ